MMKEKRDKREYGVNYRMRAVSFSRSSLLRIFSLMVFKSLEELGYMHLFFYKSEDKILQFFFLY